MGFRNLEVIMNSAEDLKNLRYVSTMDVYVVVSLSGDERYKTKQQTPVHEDGGTNPRWGHTFSFTVDEAAAHAGRLTLKFEIKDDHNLRGHMDVGWVDVPVKELLERGGGARAGEPKVMRCKVKLPSGETKGVLEFSYKFGERFSVATPPKARNEPIIADPAAVAPSSSSSAAKGGLMTALKVGYTIVDSTMTALMFGDMISDFVKPDDEAGDEADDEAGDDDANI